MSTPEPESWQLPYGITATATTDGKLVLSHRLGLRGDGFTHAALFGVTKMRFTLEQHPTEPKLLIATPIPKTDD